MRDHDWVTCRPRHEHGPRRDRKRPEATAAGRRRSRARASRRPDPRRLGRPAGLLAGELRALAAQRRTRRHPRLLRPPRRHRRRQRMASRRRDSARRGQAGPAPARARLSRAIELREHLFDDLLRPRRRRAACPPCPSAASTRSSDKRCRSSSWAPARTGRAQSTGGHRSTPTCRCGSIAISAADLLTATDQDRIKQCPGERCGWVFYDTTRNRSRRWCEDSQCGNRARAKRYYERHRAS